MNNRFRPRTYNPAKIIATGFADLDKVVVKKSSYQRFKKAVVRGLGYRKSIDPRS